MALNKASDVPAADWLYQHVKNYDNFSHVLIRFFSSTPVYIIKDYNNLR